MKNLKNLGQALSKAEQKTINGGKHHSTVGSGNGPADICMCYNLHYMYHDANGIHVLDSINDLPEGENAIAYGWGAIIPTPACCK